MGGRASALAQAGLPELEYDRLARFINRIGMGDDHHHDYTGSVRVMEKFIEMLTPEQIAAIRGEG